MATVDFFRKLVEETPAQRDQDHLPVVIHSVPQMPSRDKAIMQGAESPLPQMLAGLRSLKQQHVELVAIPCNTAHFWYDEMCEASGLHIIHIVDAVCETFPGDIQAGSVVGLLSTEATLSSRIYHDRIEARRCRLITNTPAERDEFINSAIDLVKRGRLDQAGRSFERAAKLLLERGATRLILGCTEIPVALETIRSDVMPRAVDATRALARATVAQAAGRS
jgi:aspartate racemase